MKPIYEECLSCVATPFCKKYNEQQKVQGNHCDAKFLLDRSLRLSKIPKSYLKANIYNYTVDEFNKEIYDKMKDLISDIVNHVDNGVNFLFFGNQTGTGKTYHASLILNHYIYKTCLTDKFDMETPTALFISYPELVNLLRYQRDDENTFELVEIVKRVPLLLLDDIGAGTQSDFVREQTFIILNSRFNESLSTIITSNYTVNQLNQDDVLGKRNVSRILSNVKGIELKGNDRRWRVK